MSHSTVPRTDTEAEAKENPPAAHGGATGATGKPPAGKLSLRLRFRRDRVLLLMTLPAVLLVLLFNYVPILGNVVAFQEYDPYRHQYGSIGSIPKFATEQLAAAIAGLAGFRYGSIKTPAIVVALIIVK